MNFIFYLIGLSSFIGGIIFISKGKLSAAKTILSLTMIISGFVCYMYFLICAGFAAYY